MKILVELKGHENCNSYQLNCPIFQKAITIEKKNQIEIITSPERRHKKNGDLKTSFSKRDAPAPGAVIRMARA